MLSFDIKFIDYFVSNKIALSSEYEKEFDLSHIPPLNRRRLSKLSRSMFSSLPSLAPLLKDDCVIVFGSYTGEMNRCYKLLKEIANDEIISPVSFSLSVLNAAPALMAIELKNHNEITAISSNIAFEVAVISAFCKMKSQALIIIYDELLGGDAEPDDYAFLSLLIERGDEVKLEFLPQSNQNIAKNTYLDFIKSLRNGIKFYEILDQNIKYKWSFR